MRKRHKKLLELETWEDGNVDEGLCCKHLREEDGESTSWSTSSVLTDKKSKFQGRAIAIESPSDVPKLIESLPELEKSIQKSTHPAMYAWRTGPAPKTPTNQGMADCGEAGAGIRLMGLLERTGLVNVLIVVTRWYGGTPLGGARFRHISTVAVEALKEGGFLQEASANDKKKKKKK